MNVLDTVSPASSASSASSAVVGGHGTGAARATRWLNHAVIFLVSFAALLIEISYTRIISYKLFYYYVYLVIGLALLGIGTGGVLVAVSRRVRGASTDAVLFWSLLAGAVATLGAYFVVAYAQIDTLAVWDYGTSASFKSLSLLLVLCLCVFVSFVAPGVIVATLFGRRPEAIGGLYFADLFGAGLACAVVIYLISSVGAPATVMLAVLVMAAAAAWVARRVRRALLVAAVVVAAVGAVFAVRPSLLPAQRLDSSKIAIAAGRVTAASSWGAIFRVDAVRTPNHVIWLYHDGLLGSGIYQWNGKRSFLSLYQFQRGPLSIPFRVLGAPPADVSVIGAAGGHEVLASIYFGARHIDAVELNPVTYRMVTTTFADFDGHVAEDPAVNYVNADGRSFIARTSRHYQLIWYPAPDSYAATNGALSSAYVLSESYLYTTNGIEADLRHLAGDGVFVAQFGEVDDVYDLRTTRFVTTARQALAEMGVSNASDHILVSSSQIHFFGSLPLSTILVSPSGFTPAQVATFDKLGQVVQATGPLYSPDRAVAKNPVGTYMRTPNAGLAGFYASFPYDVTPTTDNDPFFWHFARYGTVIGNFTHPLDSQDRENSVGERVLLLLLGLSVAIAALFLFLPFVAIRQQWRKLPRKRLSALFFAGVGAGFIFFEITLMQMLNLFLGYPTYSLTVVLMSLLVFTGLGALLSRRVTRRRRAIPGLLGAIAALTAFYLFGLSPLTGAMLGLPLAVRIVTAFAVLAPLGVCLGMFMPIGLGEIAASSDAPREYVAWGWAVNGFASVVGSAGATVLSMMFGFEVVLFLGFCAYVIAVGAWLALSGRSAAPA